MTTVPIIPFYASKTGFFEGARIREGETFNAPSDFKASWAQPAKERRKEERKKQPDFLARPAKEIVPDIKATDTADLKSHLAAEQSGDARKNVMAAINDELANRAANPEVKTEDKAGEADPLA